MPKTYWTGETELTRETGETWDERWPQSLTDRTD